MSNNAPSWDEVLTHADEVYRLAYRLTGNHWDAQDLMQETFVRVLRASAAYEPVNLGGWLHRITTNLFLDQARRRARLRIEPAQPGVEIPAAWQDQPERGFDSFDVDVQHALDQLSEAQRAVIVLVDAEGYSYEDAARMLGVRLGTVQSRLSRARARMRELLPHRAPAVPVTV